MSEQIKEQTNKRNKQIEEKTNSVLKGEEKTCPSVSAIQHHLFYFIRNSRNITNKKDGK